MILCVVIMTSIGLFKAFSILLSSIYNTPNASVVPYLSEHSLDPEDVICQFL